MKPSVSALKDENAAACTDDAREDSVLVLPLKLLVREVCGEDCGKSAVLSCVEEIIETSNGKLTDKLGAEVVNYEKIAFKVLLAPQLGLSVAASEFVRLEIRDNILCGVVNNVKAT